MSRESPLHVLVVPVVVLLFCHVPGPCFVTAGFIVSMPTRTCPVICSHKNVQLCSLQWYFRSLRASGDILEIPSRSPCQYRTDVLRKNNKVNPETKECAFTLHSDAGVTVKMTTCLCKHVQIQICPADNRQSPQCVRSACVDNELKEFYLLPQRELMLLPLDQRDGMPADSAFEFDIALVSEERRVGFVAVKSWENASFGYIRPSHRLTSTFFTACAVLTAPKGHVVFLTKLQPVTRGTLRIFTKACATILNRTKDQTPDTCLDRLLHVEHNTWPPCLHRKHVSPKWVASADDTMVVAFSSSSPQVLTSPLMDSLRLAFSFHPGTTRPVQTEGRWNCSSAVWPQLYRHFPCDLKPQCLGGEDEAACDYAWKARLSHYLFEVPVTFCQLCTTSDFKELQKECRDRGAEPVLFYSPQEWSQFLTALAYHQDRYSNVWIDVHPTRFTVSNVHDNYIKRMYLHTWQWRGGAVAYYLDNTMVPSKEGTNAMVDPTFSRLTPGDSFSREWSFEANSYPFFEGRNHSSEYQICEVPLPESSLQRETVVISADISNSNINNNNSSNKNNNNNTPTTNNNNTTTTTNNNSNSNSKDNSRNITTTAISVAMLLTCPLQHVTHAAFACDQYSVCQGQLSGQGLSQISATCRASAPAQASIPYFLCQSTGEGVPYSLVCDFNVDCVDKSDELSCQFPPCAEDTVDCGDKQCLPLSQVCDGLHDCKTSSDMLKCPQVNMLIKYSMTKPPALVNLDGAGHFHVAALPANTTQCPGTHYQCPGDGYCLPVYTRCNGVNDCPGHEDEAGCDLYTCRGLYRCRGLDRTICMHVQHLCDGVAHCPLQDDEVMCRMDEACPDRCVCFGNSVARAETFLRLRYLDVSGSGVTLSSILDNAMLIHLKAQARGWKTLAEITLPNLHVLDLSDNLLHDLSFAHLAPLKNLKELVLAGNPLSPKFSSRGGSFRLISVKLLNLSKVPDQRSNFHFLSNVMPYVQILDLSFSGLEQLEGESVFSKLQVLNLQGCPISDFSPDFMKEMDSLQQVTGDNYKLCCPAVLPESFTGKCLAPTNEISSCENLLRSVFYEVTGFLFSILALLGNLSSFLYRVSLFRRGENKVGFAVFVIHLAISDFLMGVYQFMIGTANRVYAGVYLWNEEQWRHSATCSVAGFLSLLSCEVSSLLICLITVDRFLVIRFPFSHLRFGVTSAQVACGVTWGLGVILASIPLLPVTSHWAFYSQTGICIPLPVTRAHFPGQHYSFAVMIVVNFTLFLLIAVGQTLIYWSVTVNTMSGETHHTTTNNHNKDSSVILREKSRSKEVTIARRLLVIAMSDFVCWFPIGVCGLVAKLGVPVPGEVNAGLATLVLPFNAALNPFLYTYTALQQKQRKQQESSLRLFVVAQVKKEVDRSLSSKETHKQTV